MMLHKLNTEHVNCQSQQVNDTSITLCSFPIDFLGAKLIVWLPITEEGPQASWAENLSVFQASM